MITIYHNPRCSKSREALVRVERFASDKAIGLNVVEYLENPPTLAELAQIQQQLKIDVGGLVRTNEEEYAALGLENADDEALLQALAAHPKLLQRPIVIFGARAVIARPPELLDEFLQKD